MTSICRYTLLFVLLAVCIPFAAAQPTVDFGVGFGTAQVKSSGSGIFDFNSFNALGSCDPKVDADCLGTPSLKGFFLGFSGSALLTKHYGIGGQVSFQPTKKDYAPLQYRQVFYDFNGIYAPVNTKRYLVEFQGGIGGAKTSFSLSQSSCIGTALCSNSTQSVGSANHFQVHAGVGVEIFLNDYLFVRPQIDLHYVPNLSDQFGSSAVPQGMIWIGFAHRSH